VPSRDGKAQQAPQATFSQSLAQPAKTTLFAGGNEADVRKSAAGDFFPSTSGVKPLLYNHSKSHRYP
jgi:hypothetical protein